MQVFSPLQEISLPSAAGVRVFLKRDDLLHPQIQGNKWRKLRHLVQQLDAKPRTIISFGGAFSNHLHALANAGHLFGFPTIGILRGSSVDPENHTLAAARACGMQLFPVSKADYDRLKHQTLPELLHFIGLPPSNEHQLLPEGGDSVEALVGCTDIAVEILQQLPADAGSPLYFCVPAGTGCTAAGLIAGAGSNAKTLVFPAAPYGVDTASIQAKMTAAGFLQNFDFQIIEHLLPKKFAQMSPELLAFVQNFESTTGVLLDPVYTSKMMYKLEELFAQQFFPSGSCVVAIHTGGLQGWQPTQP